MYGVLKDRTILLCKGSHCSELGAENIYETFKKLIKENQLSDSVKIEEIDCQKFCKFGPIIIIHPDKILYVKLKPIDISDIIDQHIIKNNIITRLLYRDPKSGETYENPDQIYTAKKLRKEQKKVQLSPISKKEKGSTMHIRRQIKEKIGNNFTIKDNKEKLKADYNQQKESLKAQKKASLANLKKEIKTQYKNEYINKKTQIKNEIQLQKEKMKAKKKQLK